MHLIWTPIPSSLTLPPEQTAARWGFLLVVASTSASAEAVFDQALELMATGDLQPSHQKAWRELWLHSTVEVAGSDTLFRAVIGCLFYLLSAFPSIHDASSSFGGVSPGGLSNGGDSQDYWGHVFWDQVLHAVFYLCYRWINVFCVVLRCYDEEAILEDNFYL